MPRDNIREVYAATVPEGYLSDRVGCHNAGVPAARPRPATVRSTSPRRRSLRLVGAAGLLAGLLAGAACLGQPSRNDDRVGPSSPRPNARDHT